MATDPSFQCDLKVDCMVIRVYDYVRGDPKPHAAICTQVLQTIIDSLSCHLSCPFEHNCSPLAAIAVAQAPLLAETLTGQPHPPARPFESLTTRPHHLPLSMIARPSCPTSFFERHHSSTTLATSVSRSQCSPNSAIALLSGLLACVTCA